MWYCGAYVPVCNLKKLRLGVTDCITVPEAERRQPPAPLLLLSAFVHDPDETGCQRQACPGAEPTTAQHTVTLPTLWISYITYWYPNNTQTGICVWVDYDLIMFVLRIFFSKTKNSQDWKTSNEIWQVEIHYNFFCNISGNDYNLILHISAWTKYFFISQHRSLKGTGSHFGKFP